MEELTRAVKTFTMEQGADIVGIGSAEAMNTEARKLQRPEENLPGAKTVLSFGIRMLNSIFKSPNIRISRSSYVYLHRSLDDIAWKIGGFLEEEGFDAVPIASDVPVEMMERGGLLADISHRHAAVQAGLGRVGLSGHFLSPRFGSRVRLVSVITTAPLIVDEPLKNEVCLGEKCRKCIESCPARAISEDGFEAKKCLSVMHEYNLYGLLKLMGKVLSAEDPEEKKHLIFDRTLSEIYMSLRSGDPPFCIKCVEVCPIGMPKQS
ncbi:MAG: epoxyqueuosine reductase [Deltaproteobacteria bacterium]|nr:epoxyqueuosine reductase [Deltaproteobacteria bacterium]